MKRNILVPILLAATIIFLIKAEEIPSFLKICHRNDPKIELCIKQSIEMIRPEISKGIPKYNIESVDPLYLGNITVFQELQSRGFNFFIRNVKSYGLSNFIIKKIKVIEHGRLYKAKMKFPKFKTTAQYSVDGVVFYLPINGSGNFRMNFTDSVAEVLLKLDPITVQNKTYAVLTKLDIELVLKSGQIRLENLFGGKEPELNDLVHQAMNDNFLTLGKEFFPLSERILSQALSKIINKFLGRFTEEQLFPH